MLLQVAGMRMTDRKSNLVQTSASASKEFIKIYETQLACLRPNGTGYCTPFFSLRYFEIYHPVNPISDWNRITSMLLGLLFSASFQTKFKNSLSAASSSFLLSSTSS